MQLRHSEKYLYEILINFTQQLGSNCRRDVCGPASQRLALLTNLVINRFWREKMINNNYKSVPHDLSWVGYGPACTTDPH